MIFYHKNFQILQEKKLLSKLKMIDGDK